MNYLDTVELSRSNRRIVSGFPAGSVLHICRLHCSSVVGFPSVAHGGNVNASFVVEYRVNDSMVADANAP